MATIHGLAADIFPSAGQPGAFLAEVCRVIEQLYTGRFPGYQAADLRYHDFHHVLQAAKVYLDLAASVRENVPVGGAPCVRQLELGLAAILFHDTGYLKTVGDDEGSGAKYTHCHVLRSCALAASVLPKMGCKPMEIDDVLGAIRSTALQSAAAKTRFSDEGARMVACMVATADYIGQMAALEYPAKLPHLFAELEEADEYSGIPEEHRVFRTAGDLLYGTSTFWSGFVMPRLENDFAGVYRLLAVPHPSGGNAYIEAIEQNIVIISRRKTSPAARSHSVVS